MQNQKTIIWDWNGTLLNDITICIDAINLLLSNRNKAIIDEITYREIFTFPVRDYYLKAGFDFDDEPFETPALEFIQEYEKLVEGAALFEDAMETLEYAHRIGYEQMILSAMHHDFLMKLVQQHAIGHFFTRISGIGDHYASGKTEIGKRMVAELNGGRNKITLVGDTVHDHEVGKALGIDVILVARGHQSEKRLRQTGCRVVGTLGDLKAFL